jgi:UDP-N-acetylmuramoyl-tripeptide--D-alanyl-D-alanine ligase
MKLNLLQITRMVDGHRYVREGDSPTIEDRMIVTGVSTDSRAVTNLELFVPIVGERFDGHDFVGQVIERGAAACLWQKDRKPYPSGIPLILVDDTLKALQQLAKKYREKLGVPIVAVTGSNGKTTTKDLIYSVLSSEFCTHKTHGNLNNHIGLPLTLLQMEEGTEIAVVEMGMSNLGEISLLSQIAQPNIAVITNIGESHLLHLGSRENIARAKLEITEGLSKDGTLIYLGDEPLLKHNFPFANISYGKNEDNKLTLQDVEWNGLNGLKFKVHPGKIGFQIPLLGEHNVINGLAAIAVARTIGMEDSQIAIGLSQAKITGMRIEVTKGLNGMTLLNDSYNASPTSVKAALRLLEQLPDFETKIAALGDMLDLGDRERFFHEEIGRFIDPGKIAFVVATGPRGRWITEGALEHFPKHRVLWFETHREVADWIKSIAAPSSVALVKASRGMKMEQIIEALSTSA